MLGLDFTRPADAAVMASSEWPEDDSDGTVQINFRDFGVDFMRSPTGRGDPYKVTVWSRRSGEDLAAPEVIDLASPARGIRDYAATLGRIASPEFDSVDWEGALHRAVRDLAAQPASAVFAWHTAEELAAIVPVQPIQVVGPFVVAEGITELSAKVKQGKTTFASAMVAARLSGQPFLGHPVEPGPVVYLTEERGPSFVGALDRFGVRDHPELHVLLRHRASAPWPEIVDRAREKARKVGANLMVVDTLSDWAGLRDEEENSTGAALAAMRPLQQAAADGLGILVIRHDRKSGGEIGDSARGASAFSGAADILLSLRRADTPGHENRRVLHAVGRFDGIPAQTVIEIRDGRYVPLGDALDVERSEVLELLLQALPGEEVQALTVDQLAEVVGLQRRATLNRVLNDLRKDGTVSRRKGFGESTRAFGYWRSPR